MHVRDLTQDIMVKNKKAPGFIDNDFVSTITIVSFRDNDF